jgi:dolichyl-phosphate mannosyltransferase polypeptide 3
MKQVWKWGSIASAATLLWLALLLAPGLPSSLTLLLPYLPVYSIVALGCYGLAMLGYGMMVFPTCPEEALLLQKVCSLCGHPLPSPLLLVDCQFTAFRCMSLLLTKAAKRRWTLTSNLDTIDSQTRIFTFLMKVWWRHHSCLQMVYWRQELVRYFAIVWWRQECLILCNSMMKARMSDPLWAPLIRSMIALKSCRASFGVARTRSRSLPSKCYCGVFSSIS